MKMILINKCDDPQMWYEEKVQKTVPLITKADNNGDLNKY